MSKRSGRLRVGDQQPPGLGGGADLGMAGGGGRSQGLGGLVHGRDDGGEIARFGSEGLRRAGRVGGAEGRGPGGVGIGEPSGPQGQVAGWGGVGCDGAAGVCGDLVPRAGGVQPGRPGLSSRVGASRAACRLGNRSRAAQARAELWRAVAASRGRHAPVARGKEAGEIDWDALAERWDATIGGQLAGIAPQVSNARGADGPAATAGGGRVAGGPEPPGPPPREAQVRAVRKALALVSEKRSTWTRRELLKRLALVMPAQSRQMTPGAAQALLFGLADEALSGDIEEVVSLEPPKWPPLPTPSPPTGRTQRLHAAGRHALRDRRAVNSRGTAGRAGPDPRRAAPAARAGGAAARRRPCAA